MTYNEYSIIVLAALALEFGLSLTADLLNLGALRPELPAELRDTYSADAYRRSQKYTRVRTRFGLLPSATQLAALLIFWFSGGFGALDSAVRHLGWGPVASGLVYIGALGLAWNLLGIPFAAVSTFVIEQRFGFNRMTLGTFVTDRLKGLALAVALGGPLLAVVLWLFERAGSLAWLYCWAVAAAFILLIQRIAPSWLMPLFLRFRPLEDGPVRQAIVAYASSVSFPLEQVLVVDGSRRSTKANAFFTGFGKRKRIALFDTLLERHEVDEVVAVVAHEIGHYRHGHLVTGMVLSIAHAGALFGLLSLVLQRGGLYTAFGIHTPSTYAGLVLFGLLYAPVELGLSLVLHALSRRHEYQADRHSAQTTGSAGPLIGALKRLAADSLVNLTPHPLYVAVHHAHPPVLERIRALRGRTSP